MHKSTVKSFGIGAIAGVVFYFVYSLLVGYAAAIATPARFEPFLVEHPTLGSFLFSLVTTIPAAAFSAIAVGYFLSRLIDSHFFASGFLAVCVAVLIAALRTDLGSGFLGDLKLIALPARLFDVPMVLILWTFLPLATVFFGRRQAVSPESEGKN